MPRNMDIANGLISMQYVWLYIDYVSLCMDMFKIVAHRVEFKMATSRLCGIKKHSVFYEIAPKYTI